MFACVGTPFFDACSPNRLAKGIDKRGSRIAMCSFFGEACWCCIITFKKIWQERPLGGGTFQHYSNKLLIWTWLWTSVLSIFICTCFCSHLWLVCFIAFAPSVYHSNCIFRLICNNQWGFSHLVLLKKHCTIFTMGIQKTITSWTNFYIGFSLVHNLMKCTPSHYCFKF
jgi:hypothetical protein